uniref:DDE-1 domain-containing protein n=1 Tax=Ganoderma boninense TaxID=34458 RepID=A0A5K1JZQ5_9APHY|nr:DDE-1 domain-containing protein [Ganoderma boninense]
MQNAHPYRPTGVGGSLNAHWRLVNVRPYSLVRLKHTINPMFPAGTIVALSDRIEVRQAPPTPTKYEGQGKPNPDANASVKIYLWRQKTTFTTALSRDGGNSLSIPHKYLVDPTTGRTGPRGGWKNEAQV